MNMIDPPLDKVLEKVDCRYTLVSIVAKRARQIVAENSNSDNEFDIKPVSLAIDDLMNNFIHYKQITDYEEE